MKIGNERVYHRSERKFSGGSNKYELIYSSNIDPSFQSIQHKHQNSVGIKNYSTALEAIPNTKSIDVDQLNRK